MKKIHLKNKKIFTIIFLASVLAAVALVMRSSNSNKAGSIDLPDAVPKVLTFNKNDIFNVGELKYEGGGIAQVTVKYIDNEHIDFYELYVTQNIDGKDTILYRMDKDGFFRFGDLDLGFDSKKLGGFRGYQLAFIGNDFFVVQYIGDTSIYSAPVVVYWDNVTKQFPAIKNVPKAVLDILHAK